MTNNTGRESMHSNENIPASQPMGIYPFPQIEKFEVRKGEQYGLVAIIQIMLDVLRIYYDTFGAVPLGGYYDGITENAIREFQRINGISETGRVDMLTWNRLAEEFNSALYENQ